MKAWENRLKPRQGGNAPLTEEQAREEKLDYFLHLCKQLGMSREEITSYVCQRLNEVMDSQNI